MWRVPWPTALPSEELVEAMARGGMLGVFGSAGLSPTRVEQAIDRLETRLGALTVGEQSDSPAPVSRDSKKRSSTSICVARVRRVSASAYLKLTLPLVRYRTAGVYRARDGRVVAPNPRSRQGSPESRFAKQFPRASAGSNAP